MNWQLFKRFTFGLAIGLFITVVIWSYSAYYLFTISWVRGIVTSLIVGIFFGILACFVDIDKLLDNFPTLPF